MRIEIKKCNLSPNDIYTHIYVESQSGSYCSYIRGKRCKTEKLFFNEISASLQFPYYFGENWAALDECLCDLEWICFKKLFVVIEDYSCLFSAEDGQEVIQKKHLLRCLEEMIDYWKSEGIPVELWLNN